MLKSKTKTALQCFRVKPRVRSVIERAADAGRRSLADMAEILILDGCKHRGIVTPENIPAAQAKKPLRNRAPASKNKHT